ncbi:hypothetical protein Bbelb_108180 [Branchiostoma belcheri]|nr:hypothetical protein Bbelb_108180 [Branchiostoma belcheri]
MQQGPRQSSFELGEGPRLRHTRLKFVPLFDGDYKRDEREPGTGNGNNDMDVGGSTTHNRHQVSIDPGTYFVTRILLKALIVGLAILIGSGAHKLWQWCRSKAKKQAETEVKRRACAAAGTPAVSLSKACMVNDGETEGKFISSLLQPCRQQLS